MIQKAINQWYAHSKDLEEYLLTHDQEEYATYSGLLKATVKLVLNAEGDDCLNLDIDKMQVIDNGEYQGTQLFIIPKRTYQPSEADYVWTSDYYGSCSVCDTILGIRDEGNEMGKPSKKQAKLYMNLCLHQVQRLEPLINDERDRAIISGTYTIHCTQEQARRAQLLGAPIYAVYQEWNADALTIETPDITSLCVWMQSKGVHAFASPSQSKWYPCINRQTENGEWYITDRLDGYYDTYKEALLCAVDQALTYLERQKEQYAGR